MQTSKSQILLIKFKIDINKAKSVLKFLVIIKIKTCNVNLCFNAIHANLKYVKC